jgi:hypothetical protein
VLDFITQFLPVDFASDQDTRSVDTLATYYYPAATELGSYGPLEEHLEDLLEFLGTYSVDYYALPIPGRSFDTAPMLDVGEWVKTESEHILFVYGGNDPWGAGAFEIEAGRDAHKLVVPGGNHGASLTDPLLPAADRQSAFELLQAWTGITPAIPEASQQGTNVRPVSSERAHHLAVERIEGHAPLDRGLGVGIRGLDQLAQLDQDRAQRGRLFVEERVDRRAVVGALAVLRRR